MSVLAGGAVAVVSLGHVQGCSGCLQEVVTVVFIVQALRATWGRELVILGGSTEVTCELPSGLGAPLGLLAPFWPWSPHLAWEAPFGPRSPFNL